MKVVDNRFFQNINIDRLNGVIQFAKNNKIYKRRFKTSYTTISNNFGYAIFRFENEFYKIKM